MVIPTSESHAHFYMHKSCGSHHHTNYPSFNEGRFSFFSWSWMKHAKTPCPSARDNKVAGKWAIGCGFAAASATMIGTVIKANDKNDPRQLTIFEAGWHAAACPVLLPWALLVTATCSDNKATYEIARQAYRFNKRVLVPDYSPFTAAYGEACRTGKLSPEFLAFLKTNRLALSKFYLHG
jgi:hypothetical protein